MSRVCAAAARWAHGGRLMCLTRVLSGERAASVTKQFCTVRGHTNASKRTLASRAHDATTHNRTAQTIPCAREPRRTTRHATCDERDVLVPRVDSSMGSGGCHRSSIQAPRALTAGAHSAASTNCPPGRPFTEQSHRRHRRRKGLNSRRARAICDVPPRPQRHVNERSSTASSRTSSS